MLNNQAMTDFSAPTPLDVIQPPPPPRRRSQRLARGVSRFRPFRAASPVWEFVALAAVLLLFALGLAGLQRDALWFDEAKTALYTGARHFGPLSIDQIVENLRLYDPWQSPGYFVLLRVWTAFVGWSDFAARYLSLLFGVATVAAVYRIGRDFVQARTGAYAAVILAGSALFIHYQHEMRPYTLYALMTCLAVWGYWEALHSVRRWRWGLVVLLIGLLGLAYSHVLALFTAIGIGVYHLLFAVRNRRWWLIVAVQALAALLFLPWLTVTLRVIGLAQSDTVRQAVALQGEQIVTQLLEAFSNNSLVLILVLLALSLLGLRQRFDRFLWVWLVAAVGSAVTLSFVVPAFIHVRYLMSVWVALALLGGMGLERLAMHQRELATFVLAAWFLVGSVMSFDNTFYESLANSRYSIPRQPFVTMAGRTATHVRAQDALVIHSAPPGEEWSTDDTHAYYFDDIAAPVYHMELLQPIASDALEAVYDATVDATLGDVPVVYVTVLKEVPHTRRRDAFYSELAQTHTRCATLQDDAALSETVYAGNRRIPQALFEGGVAVQPLWDAPVISDDTLTLLLGWQVDTRLVAEDTYSVGLQLLDGDGSLVSQWDAGLPTGATPCAWATLPLDAVAPGRYELVTLVYDYRTGQRLLESSGDDAVQVATVEVP